MKGPIKYTLVSCVITLILSGCTLSEKADTEIYQPPQTTDSLTVQPWIPDNHDPMTPIGH